MCVFSGCSLCFVCARPVFAPPPPSFFCLLPCATFPYPSTHCSSLKFQLVGQVGFDVCELPVWPSGTCVSSGLCESECGVLCVCSAGAPCVVCLLCLFLFVGALVPPWRCWLGRWLHCCCSLSESLMPLLPHPFYWWPWSTSQCCTVLCGGFGLLVAIPLTTYSVVPMLLVWRCRSFRGFS